jgi:hypothetical protein
MSIEIKLNFYLRYDVALERSGKFLVWCEILCSAVTSAQLLHMESSILNATASAKLRSHARL